MPYTDERRIVASYATYERMHAALMELNASDTVDIYHTYIHNAANRRRPYQIQRVVWTNLPTVTIYADEARIMPIPVNVPPELPSLGILGNAQWGVMGTAVLRAQEAATARDLRHSREEAPRPVEFAPRSQCDECGRLTVTDSHQVRGFYANLDLCGNCVRDVFVECFSCCLLVRSTRSSSANGEEYCEPCYDEQFTECEYCDAVLDRDDEEGCDCDGAIGRRSANDVSDPCTCHSCRAYRDQQTEQSPQRDGTVHYYSYRPEPVFRGDGPLYLGMEIEVTTPSSRYYRRDEDSRALRAGDVYDSFGDIVYVKEDSSISHGFEIVTHPMTYAWAHENFPWDKWNFLAAQGIGADESTGIHVHVSRAGFSGASHSYRWLQFFYRNAMMIKRIARRTDGTYSRFDNAQRHMHKTAAKGFNTGVPCNRCWSCRNNYQCETLPRPERYSAINLTNRETFEVRVFASSVCPQEIQAALGLVSASVEYTRSIDANAILRGAAWTWAPFTDWVAQRPEYTALKLEMDKLCVS